MLISYNIIIMLILIKNVHLYLKIEINYKQLLNQKWKVNFLD